MNFDALLDERGSILIANFVNGFAAGWKMAVPEVFRDALDIKLTPRKVSGKTVTLWTQGQLFDFHDGDMLYDSQKAYESWDKAIEHVSLAVQVTRARPSRYITYQVVSVQANDLVVFVQNGNAVAKPHHEDGLTINKKRIDHGFVGFTVYRPNDDRCALMPGSSFECTQEAFIAFLQTGIVRMNNIQHVDLFADASTGTESTAL